MAERQRKPIFHGGKGEGGAWGMRRNVAGAPASWSVILFAVSGIFRERPTVMSISAAAVRGP